MHEIAGIHSSANESTQSAAAAASSGGPATSTSSSTPRSANSSTSEGRGSRSATANRSSDESRPRSSHSGADRSDVLGHRGGPVDVESVPAVAPLGHPPQGGVTVAAEHDGDAAVAVRFRVDPHRVELANSPSKDATSSRHSVRMASTYSAARAARRANGTPSASNSSRDHPMPMPNVNRPPDSLSSVAACLASSTGLCSGSSSTPVAMRIVEVAAATKLSPIIGSSQSASAGTAIRPSSEYG